MKILLVEDNPGDARLIREYLSQDARAPFELVHVDSLERAFRQLSEMKIDLVLLDLSLPDGSGMDTIRRMQTAASGVPIIVLTGLNDEEVAVKALREGAQDYLTKGKIDSDLLVRAMQYAVQRKRAEEEMRVLAKFSSENPNPVLRAARDGRILYANASSFPLLEIWGCQIGQPLPDFWYPLIAQVLDSGLSQNIEVKVNERTFGFMLAPVQDDHYVYLYGQDNTEQKRAEEALAEQAVRDTLTGLYNRRYFDARMEEETARANRNNLTLAVLLCDLDRFKLINDIRGHQFGDEVLKSVSKVIQRTTRGVDLAFRWGGDEFVVVLYETMREGVLIAAERIRKGIQKVGEQEQLDLDLSIGVALYPEHGRSIDELIRLADRALYIAKKGGDKIHIGEEEYHLTEQSIKVVFQPIVRLGEVIGYEALGRDAQGKLTILELFKKYNAIGQLNELKRLCFISQIRAAQDLRLERLFVNVDFNVLNQLGPLPKPTGLDVILEISEAEALYDIENHLEIARKWRGKGFKIAIDDFGAGFISLPFIANLMPDYIKVDRSTIMQAVDSEKFRKFFKDLVRALRNYTKEGIIAEGIETEKELKVMEEIGISILQGFLFGKPQELN